MHNLALKLPCCRGPEKTTPCRAWLQLHATIVGLRNTPPATIPIPTASITFEEKSGLLDASITARRAGGGGGASSFTVRMGEKCMPSLAEKTTVLVPSGRENSKGVDAVGAYTENTLIWKTATTERVAERRFTSLRTSVRSYSKYQGSFHSYHPYPLVLPARTEAGDSLL